MVSRTDQNSQADVKLGAGEEETPQITYSEEQVAKLVTDAKTSALADVGRLRVEANKALAAATAAEQRIKAMEKARQDAEIEAAQDNPPELARIRERQGRIKAEDELATAMQELNENKERLRQLDAERVESTKERNAREIATRLGVDPKRLIKLAKFTDGTPEAIEDLAKELPKVAEGNPPFTPDSSRTRGGATQNATQVRQDYIAGKINTVQYAEKMKALGQQP